MTVTKERNEALTLFYQICQQKDKGMIATYNIYDPFPTTGENTRKYEIAINSEQFLNELLINWL
jgi:hypothetical protein